MHSAETHTYELRKGSMALLAILIIVHLHSDFIQRELLAFYFISCLYAILFAFFISKKSEAHIACGDTGQKKCNFLSKTEHFLHREKEED